MKKRYWVYSIIILTFLLLIYPVTSLQITDEANGDNLLYQTLTNVEEKFSIEWIHSVSKQPVIETYRINEDLTISIEEMLFNEHGPNLPSGPEGGTKWEIKNGTFRVYNYSVVFDKVPVRIGEVIANHTFIYKGEAIELKSISRPGGFVNITAGKIPLIEYVYKEVKLWLKIK